MKLNRKIYYLKSNGNIIQEVGDMQGFVVESTFEEDYENYTDLKKYDKDKIGCLKLEYGQLGQLLADNKANSYRVDVTSNPHKLAFKWIDYETGQPGEPPKSVEDLIKETENKIEKQEKRINVLSSTLEELILGQ
ncbi:hypothetical protein [Peptostreptococcus stomatis]